MRNEKEIEIDEAFNDSRYERVIGFLSGKGLLLSNRVTPSKRSKLDVVEALWVGENLEPRVLEVLPAAVLRFRGQCKRRDALPQELADAIKAIGEDRTPAGGYLGVSFEAMHRWARAPLPDKRTKSISDRKRLKSFRFSPVVLEQLARLAKKEGITETAVLEELVKVAAERNQ